MEKSRWSRVKIVSICSRIARIDRSRIGEWGPDVFILLYHGGDGFGLRSCQR
jgi:hypothetical protein